MDRDQILESIKDLVRTLLTPNIHEPKVQRLWREKVLRTQEAWGTIVAEDQHWIYDQYSLWYYEEIDPQITADQKEFAKQQNFPFL